MRRTALVTGGSRGVGAVTCLELAARGFDIALTYRNKAARAEQIGSAVRALGREVLVMQTDITDPDQVLKLGWRLRDWGEHLNVLVLNASGGLERDLVAADPDYPMRINSDAQLMVLEMSLPLLRSGGTIVHVTSHWAHLYPDAIQVPHYEPVARTKYAGEQALRRREAYLRANGLRLIVVTGDIIEGTITAKLLDRVSPGLGSARRQEVGELPTTAVMAKAIAEAAVNDELRSGHTVVVGGSLDSIPRRQKLAQRSLSDRRDRNR